jgi:putative ABC transport system permease protein
VNPDMTESITTIPFTSLAIAFIPVIAVIIIIWKWRLSVWNSVYAMIRMLFQLLLIGYVLIHIFETDNPFIIVAVLLVMLLSSSWIALGTLKKGRPQLYLISLASITVGGGLVLILISQGVLALMPWYLPRYMIPIAGMIFASAMNSVSLAGERLEAELARDVSFEEARKIALQASLIPITNSLLAVGLVSLPGMMTGQILSGVSPLIAARYQIMVMCMIFGASGISAAMFMSLAKANLTQSTIE